MTTSTGLANLVAPDRVMDPGIRMLTGVSVEGPAFIVQCAPGDNLMMHAAIYRAQPGDVIVCDAGGSDLAVAGGNVCAVAQRNGVAGFVIDGTIRDVAEARELGFPVFSRGTCLKPGTKKEVVEVDEVVVGGVTIRNGDWIVADEDGIAVGTREQAAEADKPEPTLDEWAAEHRKKISAAVGEEL